MASYFPPTEDLPIFDNEVFDASNSDAQTLTIAKANLLYLRKTIADTATALETFNAGILSSSINPLTSSGTINMCTSNLASLLFGVPSGGQIAAFYGVNQIFENPISSTWDTLTSSTNMSLAAKMTTATLSIGTAMTSGIMNIGTLAGRSGIIHIGDGNNCTAAAPVLINNGNVNASNTSINSGNGASTGTVTIASGTGVGNTTKVNISTGSTTGLVNIGNNNTSVTMNSNNLILGSSTKILTANCPITVAYLQTEITSNTQIGFKVNGTSLGVTNILASTLTSFWSVSLVAGTWILHGNVKYASPGAFAQLYIAEGLNTADDSAATSIAGLANTVIQVSRIIVVGTGLTPTYYLTGGVGNASTVSNVVFRVFRLA